MKGGSNGKALESRIVGVCQSAFNFPSVPYYIVATGGYLTWKIQLVVKYLRYCSPLESPEKNSIRFLLPFSSLKGTIIITITAFLLV